MYDNHCYKQTKQLKSKQRPKSMSACKWTLKLESLIMNETSPKLNMQGALAK